MQGYDDIITGSVAPGSVVTEILCASGRYQALLLEAGGAIISQFIAAPVGETALLETRVDPAFKS